MLKKTYTPKRRKSKLSPTSDGPTHSAKSSRSNTSLVEPCNKTNPSTSTTQNGKSRHSGWKGLEKAMRALHLSAEAIPPVQSAVRGLVSCLGQFEAARKNREEYNQVVTELGDMADYLSRHLKDPRSQGLTEKISEIAGIIEKETEDVCRSQEQSKAIQVLSATDHEQDLARRFRRIGELFRRIQMEMSMSEWSKTDEILVNTYLEKLKPSMLAFYNSKISDAIGRRACTKQTREETLSEIDKWCEDPNSPSIYWMNGMAGTGKTTIAYTLASKLRSLGRLGASFFCTVTSEECRDASSIIPTIAYQLAYQSTPFQAALGESMKKEPGAATTSISEQVQRLLLVPLESAQSKMARNLVVIIDALDECHQNGVVTLILDALISSARQLQLKFFVASRPEPAIYHRLVLQPDNLRLLFHLHEVHEDTVKRDIQQYLLEGLALIQPSESEIDQLVALSGRLFIYAATAVRYIAPDNPSVDSGARLKIMLDMNSRSTKKQSGIDALYSAILSGAVDNDCLEPNERERLLSVVWTVVCSDGPVSSVALVVEAGLGGESAALAALAPLRSVLHVSHTNDTISTFHASFPQFIFDRSRSNHFFCDKSEMCRNIHLRCLESINIHLPHSIQHDTVVSPYATYACLEWLSRFTGWPIPWSDEYHIALKSFFENRFESWLWVVTNNGASNWRTAHQLVMVRCMAEAWPGKRPRTIEEGVEGVQGVIN